MNYVQFTKESSDKMSRLPMFFAFSDKQLEAGMKKLKVTDTHELCHVGAGGYMKREDAHLFSKTLEEIEAKKQKLFKKDSFLKEALHYELANHEYTYTRNPSSALDALGLSLDDKRVRKLFKQVHEEIVSMDE